MAMIGKKLAKAAKEAAVNAAVEGTTENMANDMHESINPAAALKHRLDDLEKAKMNAEREMMGLGPIQNWKDELRLRIYDSIRRFFFKCFCPCLADEMQRQRLLSFFHIPKCDLCIPGTRINKIYNNCLAFLCGWLLPLPFLILGIYMLAWSPYYLMWIFGFSAFMLSLLFALAPLSRCYMLILLPTFLSEKGTWFLIAYCVYVTYNGPGKNFQNNCEILAKTVVCMNEKMYNATKDLVDAVTSPLHEILMKINKALDGLRKVANIIMKGFQFLKNMLMIIINTFMIIYKWLMSTREECNRKISEPYNRCMIEFRIAEENCIKMGFSFLCKIVSGTSGLCKIVLIAELLCIIIQLVKTFVAYTLGPVYTFVVDNLYAVFYFSLSYEYSFNYVSTQSRAYSDVAKEIFTEAFKSLVEFIQRYLTGGVLFMFCIFFYIAFEPIWYIYNYRFFDKYDNYYFGWDMLEIETKRKKRGKPILMPLRNDENEIYVTEGQMALCYWEKRGLIATIFLFFAMVFYCGYMVGCDFLLYHIMNLVVTKIQQFKFQTLLSKIMRVKVDGEGLMSTIYRALISQFDWIDQPPSGNDLRLCLRGPREPSQKDHLRIFLCWVTVIASIIYKPFVYRTRHNTADFYFPERKIERTIWLYNHVLRKRVPLMRNEANKIHDNYSATHPDYQPTMLDRLAAQYWCVDDLLMCLRYKTFNCMNCAIDGQPGDDNFVKCVNYGCSGFYCKQCYNEMNKVCAICFKLITYDDEVVSEEGDSSDEDIKEDRRQIIKINKLHHGSEQVGMAWDWMSGRRPMQPFAIMPGSMPPSGMGPMRPGMRPFMPYRPGMMPMMRPGMRPGALQPFRPMMPGMMPRLRPGMMPMTPGIRGRMMLPMRPGMRGRMLPPGMMPPMRPGMMPPMRPGMMPRMRPDMMPRMRPGMMPRMAPGMRPGMMPRMRPGMMPRIRPGMMPPRIPGMMPQLRPGMPPFRPGMMPPMRPGMMLPLRPGMRPGMMPPLRPGMVDMRALMRPGMIPPLKQGMRPGMMPPFKPGIMPPFRPGTMLQMRPGMTLPNKQPHTEDASSPTPLKSNITSQPIKISQPPAPGTKVRLTKKRQATTKSSPDNKNKHLKNKKSKKSNTKD